MDKAKEVAKAALLRDLSVSVEMAGEALGLSRNSAYAAVGNGEIPSIKIGRRIVVPTAPLRKMLGIEAA